MAQLAVADILIANKIDLASQAALIKFEQLCEELQPSKLKTATISNGQIPLEWLNIPRSAAHPQNQQAVQRIAATETNFKSMDWSFSANEIFSHEKISSWLQQAEFIRAKAIVNTDLGWVIFNAVENDLKQEKITTAAECNIQIILHRLNELSSRQLDQS